MRSAYLPWWRGWQRRSGRVAWRYGAVLRDMWAGPPVQARSSWGHLSLPSSLPLASRLRVACNGGYGYYPTGISSASFCWPSSSSSRDLWGDAGAGGAGGGGLRGNLCSPQSGHRPGDSGRLEPRLDDVLLGQLVRLGPHYGTLSGAAGAGVYGAALHRSESAGYVPVRGLLDGGLRGYGLVLDGQSGGVLSTTLASGGPEAVAYALLGELPGVRVTAVMFLLLVFLSYVTAADSNVSAMSALCMHDIGPDSAEAPVGIKLLWGMVIGTTSWVLVSFAGLDGSGSSLPSAVFRPWRC